MTIPVRLLLVMLLLTVVEVPNKAWGEKPISLEASFNSDEFFNTSLSVDRSEDTEEETFNNNQSNETEPEKHKRVDIPNDTVIVKSQDIPDKYEVTELVVHEGVEMIGDGAFAGCSSLTRVLLPQSLKEIGDAAFEGCSALTRITIPQNVEKIGKGAFGLDCRASIEVDPNNANFSSVSGILFDKAQTTLIRFPASSAIRNYTIPKTVKFIADDAFINCTSLTGVVLQSGVRKIGERAFFSCESLTSVSIPEGVESVGSEAFWGCSALKSVVLPQTVRRIEPQTFFACSALKSVVIPMNVQAIGRGAFWSCESLQNIILPKGIKRIEEGTFAYCAALQNVVIPNAVETIDTGAFVFCSNLTSVTVPASVNSIDDFTFDESPVKLRVAPGSYAERWAQQHKIDYERIASYRYLNNTRQRNYSPLRKWR